MPLTIYNTATGTKEVFQPAKQKVRMFVCGPTVYDYIHIGNARTFVFFDVVAKYLRQKGFALNYIQNITDIDDKIIARAAEQGAPAMEYAKKYEEIFMADMRALGVTAVTDYGRYAHASDHIPEVVKQVKTLNKTGHAYEIEGDGWYFDLSTFPDYGKLSGRTAALADDAVSRIDENPRKRNPGDFCLWKFSKPNEPGWETILGIGRPGWHIEDTAITERYFGPQYDLHGGGQDLIFPHHEAEIAQQESASGLKPFVRYWMHVAFVVNKQAKMSKSLGNFATAHQLLREYPKEALRFFLLSGHYRSPLDFTDKNLAQSEAAINRIAEFMDRLRLVNRESDRQPAKTPVEKLETDFETAMDDDFNVPQVIGALFETIRELHTAADQHRLDHFTAQTALRILEKINLSLGIIPSPLPSVPTAVSRLAQEREDLRQKKDFRSADSLRQKIFSLGFQIEDTIYGPLIKKAKKNVLYPN